MLRGISLAQAGSPQAATEAFRQAVTLAPTNGKALHNFAKHLFDTGDRAGALSMVQEAVRVDPGNAAAQDLLRTLQGADAPAPTVAPPQYPPPGMSPPQAQPHYVPPVPTVPIHSVRFVEGLGKNWDRILYGLIIVGALVFVLSLSESVRMMTLIMNDPSALSNEELMAANTPAKMLLNILSLVTSLSLCVWMTTDIADRRTNWVWMVPFVLCCCCGLHWAVAGTYLVAEKRNRP